MIAKPEFDYTYPNRRITKYTELPPMSEEWLLREAGYHAYANHLPIHKFRSILDYAASRREKAFWRGDTL